MKRVLTAVAFGGLVIEVARLLRDRTVLLHQKERAYIAIRDLAGEVILFVRGSSSPANLEQIAEESLDLAFGATDTA